MVSTRSQLHPKSATPNRYRDRDTPTRMVKGKLIGRLGSAKNESNPEYQPEGDNKVPVRTGKRARTNQAIVDSNKKLNLEQQVERSFLMRLPVELLCEIASWVYAEDLLSLIRTNWLFRNMLLQRSSAKVWQSAADQTPGLPQCPYPDMSGPAYAALIFLKQCTFCGASVTVDPDKYLGVRLCVPCKNTELVELNPEAQDRVSAVYGLVTRAYDYRPDSELTDTSLWNSHYALRSEVEKTMKERLGYLRKRERKQLASYDEQRRKLLQEKYALCSTWHSSLKSINNQPASLVAEFDFGPELDFTQLTSEFLPIDLNDMSFLNWSGMPE